MTQGTRTGLLLLFLCLVESFFRWPALVGSLALFQRDLLLLYFPLVQSSLREISAGALPLRDATSGFGQPLLADPGSQILYPPTWIHLFLRPSLAYAWFVSLHSVFGALGVALLARRLSGGSWASAVFGGVAWLASGPLQSLATLWHHMSGAAWIPWVLLAVERVLGRAPGRPALWLGAAIGAQILAGSADMCAMTLLLAAVRILASGEGLGLWRQWAGSFGLGVVLGAGVWLPALELLRASARAMLSEAARTYWSLHPVTLIEFFLPIPFSALRLTKDWQQALFEGREPFLASAFLGVLLLPLALAALADSALSRRVRLSLLLGGTGAVLAALGKHSVFYSLIVAVVPPLAIFRYPSKALVPAAVVICVLAAIGLVSVRRSETARRSATVALVSMVVIAVALLGPLLGPLAHALLDPAQPESAAELSRNLPSDLIAGVLLLSLLYAYGRIASERGAVLLLALLLAGHTLQSRSLHNGMNPLLPAAILNFKPDHVEEVRPTGGGRLYVYDYWLFEGRAEKYLSQGPHGGASELEALTPDAGRFVTTRRYLTPLVGAYWGIEYGWDADLRRLFDRRLAELTIDLRRVEGTPAFLRLLQVSGIERVLAMHEQDLGDLRLLFRRPFFPRDLRLYEVPAPLPRAFLVSGRVRGTGKPLDDLLDPGFDPRRSVIVDQGAARPPAAGFQGTAVVTRRRSDRMTIETNASGPAFLGLLEGAMPGWRAWIDGEPAPVERANVLFIGTEVPAGRHLVEFRFLPAAAVAGVLLTALAGFFLLYALLAARARGVEGMLK